MTKEELEKKYSADGEYVHFGEGAVNLDGWFSKEQLAEIAALLDAEK